LYAGTQNGSAVVSPEPAAATSPIPEDLRIEVNIAENPTDNSNCAEKLGESVSMMCPECGGPLWELRGAKLSRYRCHIGHAFTAESLLAGQSEALEYALWAAVRTMEDRGRILTTLARGRQEHGQNRLAEVYEAGAKELKAQAQQIRQMLLEGGNL
jgi:two-component system, chemotaxis family, protein-glutamate methylesterase/glutaminase